MLLFILIIAMLATRYKKCPSDKVMVIYGKVALISVTLTLISRKPIFLSSPSTLMETASKNLSRSVLISSEKDRDGAIGQANAQKEQRIQVAAANSQAIYASSLALACAINSALCAVRLASASASRSLALDWLMSTLDLFSPSIACEFAAAT